MNYDVYMSFRLPDSLKKILEGLAEADGVSAGVIIRDALIHYLYINIDDEDIRNEIRRLRDA